jgi:phosphate transport system substrate-binding protein
MKTGWKQALLGAAAVLLSGISAGSTLMLNGAGSTFAYPLYSRWFADYARSHPGVQVNYASVGSGAGIRQLLARTVDFGASDAPMSDEELARAGFPILHFPTALGAVVPLYNLPGVQTELRFTPQALAGIYLGKITWWDDPVIAGANPGVRLPHQTIVVVHRSDGSGTTYCWTDYLSKVSPEWRQRVGRGTSVNWPVGLGAKGNEGVTGLVRQTPYALGYVELLYALQNRLGYGSVQNAAGQFIRATLQSVTAAAAAVPVPPDFRVSITQPGPSARTAYPISTYTWILVPQHIEDTQRRQAMVDLLRWCLTEGQKETAALNYAPLPAAVAAAELKQLNKLR